MIIKRSSAIVRTVRVRQLEGLFDVAPSERVDLEWSVDLPLDEKRWNIGLIVGPSGCGKSTIARELFTDNYVQSFAWPAQRALIDAFPESMPIKEITLLLSSVGFSSPPSWLRSYHVLSNGEQFRATLARALAEQRELCVFDEFTSVVDRQVAKIGAAAVAKTVRRRGQKFVAVTCHEDVLDWLDPDWVYAPVNDVFQWRSLHGRPRIELHIHRVHHSLWSTFARHHYLSRELSTASVCFAAFYQDRPVAFDAWIPFVGRSDLKIQRVHRTVCLPDFQGVGIGAALTRHIASMWVALGRRATINTSHPGIIAGYQRSPFWRVTSRGGIRHGRDGGKDADLAAGLHSSRASNRLTTSFEYKGKALDRDTAERQLNAWVA